MTTTTTTAGPTPGRTLARHPAPARARRGADHRRLLGAAAGGQRHREPRAHRALDGARGLDRQLRRRRGGHPVRRSTAGAASSPTRRSTSSSRPWRGRSAAPTTPTSTAGSARSSARVAAAQEPDGYLNTNFGRPGQRPRYSDLEWGHELYCFGHLFQAAVARARTRPDADDGLLGGRPPGGRPRGARRSARTASRRSAGTPRSSPRWPSWAGSPGSAATSTRPRCSSSAAAPARSRTSSSAGRTTRTTCRCGRRPSCAGTPCGPTTWPPARSTSRSRPTTTDLLDALTTQWENTVARRTYVTGGQGSHHEDEAFGDDFVLPRGPRLLRDVRRRRLGDVLVAAPAGPGPARGTRTWSSARSSTSSRRRRRTRAPRSTTRTRCTSGCPGRSRRRTSRARARRRRCGPRGSRCRAARRTSPARWPAWRRTSRPPTTTASSCTSTRRPASARRWPTAAASSSTSRRPTRATAWSA